MQSSTARRTAIVAVVLVGLASIAVATVIGGGSFLVAMLVGLLLGVGATPTVVSGSGESRAAAEPAPELQVDPVTGLPTHEKLVADLQEAGAAGEDRVLT